MLKTNLFAKSNSELSRIFLPSSVYFSIDKRFIVVSDTIILRRYKVKYTHDFIFNICKKHIDRRKNYHRSTAGSGSETF